MEVEEFLQQVLEATRSHAWIKRTDIQRGRQRVKIRLWMNDTFVDIYFNAERQIISYAYIEGEKRLFGANNMHVGWHVGESLDPRHFLDVRLLCQQRIIWQ